MVINKVLLILFLLLSGGLYFPGPVAAQFEFLKKKGPEFKPMPSFYPEQLKADFAVFRKSLEEAHPGLYRYTSEKNLAAKFDIISNTMHKMQTEQEFYTALKFLTGQIKCGNTVVTIPGRENQDYPFFTSKLFPVPVYFKEGKAYSLGSYSDSVSVPPGVEILAINEKKISEIVSRLMPFVSGSDGFSISPKYTPLGQNFSGYYAAFLEARPEYVVTYEKDNVTETVTLKAINLEAVAKRINREKALQPMPGWSLTFSGKETAILNFATFEQEPHMRAFEGFLEDAFEQIKASEVKNLVIDLRGNKNGDDRYGAWLFSYLATSAFKYYKAIHTNTDKRFSFMKYAEVPWNFFFYRRLLKLNPDSTFRYQYHPNLKIQKPKSAVFSGKAFVLVNGETAGPASEFASVAFANKRATIIGLETASAYKGANRGKFVKVTLPNSKFEIQIPLWAYFPEIDEKQTFAGGLIPDQIAYPEPNDLISGTDREIQFTLDLIRSPKK